MAWKIHWRGEQSIFKKLSNALRCKIELTVGDADTELGFIASIRTMGLHNIRGHVVLLNGQRQDGWNYRERKQSQSGNQGVLTCKDL